MKFKVGDRVEHELYGKGTVIGVSDMDTPLVEFDVYQHELHDGGYGEINGIRGKDGHCWFTSNIKSLNSQAIVIYPKGLETIALLKDGKKIIKSASAKCNPTDVFDFNVGAKLAFRRLMGEDTILVVNPNEPALPTFDWEAFKQGKFAVHCDTEEKAKAFLKECDEQGIKWCTGQKASSRTEYNSYGSDTAYCCYSKRNLEFSAVNWYRANGISDIFNYQSSIREVKRPAKVGEWIKVVKSNFAPNSYKVGDIYRALEVNKYNQVRINDKCTCYDWVSEPSGYVVLENYQPEETIKPSLSIYTDKELIDELAKRWEGKA